MNEKFQKLGFYPADILLPKDADMTKWAVVACDQFTSQPEYWQAVEDTVGDAPSALRLILPEARLNDPDVDDHIAAINGAMNRYLAAGVFQTLPESLFYIERTQSDGKIRHGLIGMVDLDQYDFTPGSGALIRATEGTVLSRIPPRVRVRQDAPIELPHVMLLIDDPDRTVEWSTEIVTRGPGGRGHGRDDGEAGDGHGDRDRPVGGARARLASTGRHEPIRHRGRAVREGRMAAVEMETTIHSRPGCWPNAG